MHKNVALRQKRSKKDIFVKEIDIFQNCGRPEHKDIYSTVLKYFNDIVKQGSVCSPWGLEPKPCLPVIIFSN